MTNKLGHLELVVSLFSLLKILQLVKVECSRVTMN